MLSREKVTDFLITRTKLNLMVLDFDGCTYLGENSKRQDGLNQALIEKSKNYDAVIFISHRAYYTYQLGFFKNNLLGNTSWLTHNIVNNFLKETNLVFLGVSSPDDLLHEFGQAYQGTTEGMDFKTTHPVNMPYHYLSKNPQLEQIINFILSHSPNITLEMDYYDDHEYLLADAKTLQLPDNVTLTCFLTTNNLIKLIDTGQNDRYCLIM